MADPVVADQPNLLEFEQVDFAAELGSVPIPSMPEFFSSDDSVPMDGFFPDEALDFDENFMLDFDDFDDFLIDHDLAIVPGSESDSPPKSSSPESRSSIVSGIGDCGVDGLVNSQISCPQKSDSSGALILEHPDSDNCDRQSSDGPVSSQGSGNCGLGSSEGQDSPVHSGNSDRDVSSSAYAGPEKTRKINLVPKRKKEAEEEEGNSELRTPKYRRSSESESQVLSGLSPPLDEEDEKKKARLMRNRESAQLSRQRKKHYVEELEDKVRGMSSTITDLNARISYIMAENASLRQQMSGLPGMCPQPPPPGMFPHPAMAYPWVPCPPYVLKPQGSQVPLVPIPRLRPQQHTAPTPKVKKSESKTKKVASISFLGLLFFLLLFGGLVPMVNVNFGGLDGNVPTTRLYDQHRGRVLTADHNSNRSRENVVINVKEKGSRNIPNNSSTEPLVASLYVPRNDKMVKIDGNLIIHSVLASEKTKSSLARLEMKKNAETRLAIARNDRSSYGANSGRHIPLYQSLAERQKALSSGSGDASKDGLKSSAADGRLHQWFREGLAGPMLSSGMCTEVFQFDVSPSSTSGAIVPASSVPNVSGQNITQNNSNNATQHLERINRRALQRLPVPDFNITNKRANVNSSSKDDLKGNRSVSSMVVSVLVDPREAGDAGDIDGMVKPKSLSRIFVVVLMDSVKYVTYSCVLPRAAPHLVTA